MQLSPPLNKNIIFRISQFYMWIFLHRNEYVVSPTKQFPIQIPHFKSFHPNGPVVLLVCRSSFLMICTGSYLTKVSSNPGAGDVLMGFLGSVILSFAFSMFKQRKVNNIWRAQVSHFVSSLVFCFLFHGELKSIIE